MANTKITNRVLDKTVITGQSAVTVADGDYILVADASDSSALKKVLASDLIQSSEEVADIVGAMVSSNTESGITVAYEDSDNTIDFTIGTLNQNTTGSAATLTTARTIGGTSFDGSANIAVGLAATATALATSRTIHGVGFDGSANIDLSEVISDTVGAMFSSNTETNITATYQDADNTIDLVVDASQPNVTSLGTLTSLTVDDIIINGTNIGHTSDTDSIAIASNGVVTFSQIPVLPANSIDSDYYVDGSIDTAHIADSQITVAKMAANSVDSDQYVDGSIDTAHIADDQVTGDKLSNNITIAGTLTAAGDIIEVQGATPEFKLTDSDDNNYGLVSYSDGTLDVSSNHGNESGGADVLNLKTGGVTQVAVTNSTVTVTGSARGTLTTDDDGSFDMNATNNFKCTPSGNFTLTFTNIASQSGNILLINSGGHTVSAHSNTKVDANILGTISTAGTYLLAYFSDGTNVYMTNSAIYS